MTFGTEKLKVIFFAGMQQGRLVTQAALYRNTMQVTAETDGYRCVR